MSCQIKLKGSIADLTKVKRILLPEEDIEGRRKEFVAAVVVSP